MSIAVLIISHKPLGSALMQTATRVFNTEPENCALYDMPLDQDQQLAYQNICALRDGLDCSSGLLILTDLYGSTPHNVAKRLMHVTPSILVSGLSLAMLLCIFNDDRKDLEQMARNFTSNGHLSIHADSGEDE